jgi:aspartyl-tRNA synthetase
VHTRSWISETPEKVSETVKVAGWVQSRRDHGGLIFFDLRDRSGLLQCVVKEGEPAYETAKELRAEYVVEITGELKERPANLQNPELATGTVELKVEELTVLNEAETPPFEINSGGDVSEELRMTYRYLDLRNERPKRNLELRHRIVRFMRDFLSEEGFWEIETPYITKGTPEGAREFVIPSRLRPGQFYTLPQSPQQFKQLLMVAGLERYFQIARAFRDEDPRGDRAYEHTQLDLEMSFVGRDEVLALTERLFTSLVKNVTSTKKLTSEPWPVLTYAETMEKYGTDKPDLRGDTTDPNELAFAFIIDFPLFKEGGDGKLTSEHHPFCMPHPEDVELIESDPRKIRAYSYDMVLNGYELASGSVRIHRRDVQERVFLALGLSEEEILERFGHLLRAFSFGAPPHAGIAPGVDRIAMILAGEPNIREVTAFPKTGDGRDLMMGAPSPLPEQLLEELHINVIPPKNEQT